MTSMSSIDKTYKDLDEAISEHLREAAQESVFSTGWVLVASVSSVLHDSDNVDGYMTFTSDGLQHHSHIGLLSIALDERKNIGLLSLIDASLSDEGGEE